MKITNFLLITLLLLSSCNQNPAWAEELQASWYSVQSLKTEGTWKTSKGVMANGEKFVDGKNTCATRDYELGTLLKITNIKTGKSILVKVTDRISKHFRGKRIDLSKRAFSQIANLKQGLISCRVEVIKLAERK